MAIKFNEDSYYSNEYYSSVGGISCSEINKLEAEMLSLLNYNLVIVPSKFNRYLHAIRSYYQQLISPSTPNNTKSRNVPIAKAKSVMSTGGSKIVEESKAYGVFIEA